MFDFHRWKTAKCNDARKRQSRGLCFPEYRTTLIYIDYNMICDDLGMIFILSTNSGLLAAPFRLPHRGEAVVHQVFSCVYDKEGKW